MPTQDGSGRAARLMALETLLRNSPGRRWRTREVAAELGVGESTLPRRGACGRCPERVALAVRAGDGGTWCVVVPPVDSRGAQVAQANAQASASARGCTRA